MSAGNPWLRIGADDYEGQMADPQVAQLAFLAEHFAALLSDLAPRRVAAVLQLPAPMLPSGKRFALRSFCRAA